MLRATTAVVFVGVVALGAGPVAAQIKDSTSEVHAFVGGIYGDNLTDRSISGDTPQLDGDLSSFGVRYTHHFSQEWGLEVSAGYNSDTASNLPGDDIDLRILTADVDAVWHFRPQNRLVGFLVGGAGYARADLDSPITGTVQGRTVDIHDDGGLTANAGIGAKYFLNDAIMLRAESRYRYMSRLVDRFDSSLNTMETSVGIGWQF